LCLSVVALHYFGALIILCVCFKCHQKQDPHGNVLILNDNKVVSELGPGIHDGWRENDGREIT